MDIRKLAYEFTVGIGGQKVPRYFFSTGTVGTLEKSTGTAVAVLLFLNFWTVGYSVLLQNFR